MANGTATPPRLDIVVIGAGIAGLAAGTALSQSGHRVTILEHHPVLHEFGASIDVWPNATRCLRAWGLVDDFENVVSRSSHREIRNGFTGELLAQQALNVGNSCAIDYGDENWAINRKDYQDTLANAALRAGTKIIFAVDIESIDVDTCTVLFTTRDVNSKFDGLAHPDATPKSQKTPSSIIQSIDADIIIGADGMRSMTRNAIPAIANIEPIPLSSEMAYRCTVPKQHLENLSTILPDPNSSNNPSMTFSAPGRYILTWPLSANRAYDIVLGVQTPGDIPPGRWGTPVSIEEAQNHFHDFCPMVKEMLSHMDSAVKWTLGELPPLLTCKSDNGRIVLIGDAWHAMIPHSGSGGSSAIEDAVCLTECLNWACERFQAQSASTSSSTSHSNSNSSSGFESNDNATVSSDLHSLLAQATNAYEKVRKPRVERLQIASHEGYNYHGSVDQATREAALHAATAKYKSELTLPEEERRKRPKTTPDMTAKYPLPAYVQWLFDYDTVTVTQEYLAKLD